MPFSGRPLWMTAATAAPVLSRLTNSESMSEGPVSPPPASRPWQKAHCCWNRVLPLSMSSLGATLFCVDAVCRSPVWAVKGHARSTPVTTSGRPARGERILFICFDLRTLTNTSLPPACGCSNNKLRIHFDALYAVRLVVFTYPPQKRFCCKRPHFG